MVGVALKCARNAREDVKEEETTSRGTTKITEAAIMKGELITPRPDSTTDNALAQRGRGTLYLGT